MLQMNINLLLLVGSPYTNVNRDWVVNCLILDKSEIERVNLGGVCSASNEFQLQVTNLLFHIDIIKWYEGTNHQQVFKWEIKVVILLSKLHDYALLSYKMWRILTIYYNNLLTHLTLLWIFQILFHRELFMKLNKSLIIIY